MKKIHLLKPDVRTGYLNHGEGQEITYVNIPKGLGLEELKDDVKNGAIQYEDLVLLAEKEPSQFVVLQCHNEEEGLAAVSYLAAVYNKHDGLDLLTYDEENSIGEKAYTVVREYADLWTADKSEECEDDEDNWNADDRWQENPYKIPIVSVGQLMLNPAFGFDTLYDEGLGMGAMTNRRQILPYWYYTRSENICFVCRVKECRYINLRDKLLQKMKRFAENRHVFFLVVTELCDTEDEEEQDDVKHVICELILEYAAKAVIIQTDEGQRKRFYTILLENWVWEYGYRLEKGFPLGRITKSIVSMRPSDKSALIEKVVRYVIKEETVTTVLKEADFMVLEKFKLLGTDSKKKERGSIRKLESELIGMQEVKEQIRGIVDVMKYNKRRQRLGLKGGNYHNVHMLLGAPGTAKTTVAKLLGNIMLEENLLYDNRFIVINGAELKGMYVGHSAPKVKAIFENYDIILIDEAYAVTSGKEGENDSFSREAIAQLIVELEQHGMDRLVMFAGYGGSNVTEQDNKMREFLNSNPGIRSRINSTIFFDSYTAEQMVDIFYCHAKKNHFLVNVGATEPVRCFFETRVERSDFGNGREARSLLENCMVEAAKRLAEVPEEKLTQKLMKEIKLQDVENAIARMQKGMEMQEGRSGVRIGF